MNQKDLQRARDHWYAAYFAGDVEWLCRVQADGFTVTTEQGVQSKKSQIDAISSAKRNGGWFPHGGAKHDTELALLEGDDITTVTGKGFTLAGNIKGPLVAFSETWQWDGAAWQVLSLSFSAAGN